MLKVFFIFTLILTASNISYADTPQETLLKAVNSTKKDLFQINLDLLRAKSLSRAESTKIFITCYANNCNESDHEKMSLLEANEIAYERLINNIGLIEKDLEALRRDLIYIKLIKAEARQFAIDNISTDKNIIEFRIKKLEEKNDSKDVTYNLHYEKYFEALKKLHPLLLAYKITSSSPQKNI
jgi:hypothetical protein